MSTQRARKRRKTDNGSSSSYTNRCTRSRHQSNPTSQRANKKRKCNEMYDSDSNNDSDASSSSKEQCEKNGTNPNDQHFKSAIKQSNTNDSSDDLSDLSEEELIQHATDLLVGFVQCLETLKNEDQVRNFIAFLLEGYFACVKSKQQLTDQLSHRNQPINHNTNNMELTDKEDEEQYEEEEDQYVHDTTTNTDIHRHRHRHRHKKKKKFKQPKSKMRSMREDKINNVCTLCNTFAIDKHCFFSSE